jgi:GH18 family chitinase
MKTFKREFIVNKLFLCSLLIAINLVSCDEESAADVGVAPSQGQSTVPPKAPDSKANRKVMLYYSSYSRYNGLTAEDVLRNPDFQHDVFVPSFCIIGNGAKAVGSETSAWKKNYLGYDDVWAWSNLVWNSNHSLEFANGSDIGSGNINAALNQFENIPYSLAIGGWPANDDPNDPLRTGGFDRVGYYASDLTEFANNIKNNTSLAGKVVRQANELSLDYEFPLTKLQGGFLTKIVKEIKNVCGNLFKINVAVGPNNTNHLDMLDFSSLNNYVDSFEIMTYDYHGAWDNTTGHHTALYSNMNGVNDSSFKNYFNVDSQVNYVLDKGINASKVKIGVALYGRYYTGVVFPDVVDPTMPYFKVNGGALPSGIDSSKFKNGIILYHDIITEVTASNGWELYYDTTAHAAFAINRAKGMFLSYDSLQSIDDKIAYAKSKNIGGIIIWDAIGAKGTDIVKHITTELHKN